MKKVRIAQIGVTHEHACSAITSLKIRQDIFDIAGYVDDREELTLHPAYMNPANLDPYDGVKKITLEDVFNDPELDAVAVETGNYDLVPTAMMFMERGIPVYMDKPGGNDLAEFKKLLAGFKAKNLPFEMGYMFRVNPMFDFCQKAIADKLIGEVSAVEVDMNHCYGGEPYQEYMGKLKGGIMYNLGCHLIDSIVTFFGCPEKVTPILRSAPGYPPEIKNNCTAILEYPNNIVTLHACSKVVENTVGRRMRIMGDKGSITFTPLERFDGVDVELELRLAEDRGTFPAGCHTIRFNQGRDRHQKHLEAFARAVRGEAPTLRTREHDLLVQEVLLAASGYENIIPGKETL